MHYIDRSENEPRWAGYVRLSAAALIAAVVATTAIIDVTFMASNDEAIQAATTPMLTICPERPAVRVNCHSEPQQ